MKLPFPTLNDLTSSGSPELPLVVLHAKPRCEKKLQALFAEHGLPVYFPVERRTYHYGNREREFEIPLFGGYVFCRVHEDREAWVKQNQYVANYLSVTKEEELLSQLYAIEQAMQDGISSEVYSYLVEGQVVRVRSGPMKGVEGVIQVVGNDHRIVINVDMIQQSVAMEIDQSLDEPIL